MEWLILISAAFVALEFAALRAAAKQLIRIQRWTVPTGAKPVLLGPSRGLAPYPMTLRLLDGTQLEIGKARAKPMLLLFYWPGCTVCRDLAPSLRTLHRVWRREVDLVLVSSAPAGELLTDLREQGLAEFPASSSPILWDAWGVNGSPIAFVLDRGGVIREKGIVNTIEQIEYLLDDPAPSAPAAVPAARAATRRDDDLGQGADRGGEPALPELEATR